MLQLLIISALPSCSSRRSCDPSSPQTERSSENSPPFHSSVSCHRLPVVASPSFLCWVKDGVDVALGDERGGEIDHGGESHCHRRVGQSLAYDEDDGKENPPARNQQLMEVYPRWSARSFSRLICPKTGHLKLSSIVVRRPVRNWLVKSRLNGPRLACELDQARTR